MLSLWQYWQHWAEHRSSPTASPNHTQQLLCAHSAATTTTNYYYHSHTLSVRAFCNVCRVCLSCIRSRKLSELDTKFCCLYRKLRSPSKNMTSDFAPEVAKYPKSSPKPQNSRKWGSWQLSKCVSLLFHSISDAASYHYYYHYNSNINLPYRLSANKITNHALLDSDSIFSAHCFLVWY